MPRRLTIIIMTGLLITGCGGGDDAIKDAGSQPNSFPGNKNPANGFSEQSTGDSSNNSGLEQNEIRVTVEVPGSLAPDAERSRRNLRLVQPDSLRVYRTNHTLNDLGSVDVTRRTDDDGFTVLKLPNGQPLAPNIVIEATVNGQTLRGLATDTDRDVKINPFSEFLVRDGLGGYSQSDYQAALDCINNNTDDGILCLNAVAWRTLSDQIHDFEIAIADNATLSSAITQLRERSDLTRYVDDMAQLATLPPGSGETIDGENVNMNAVFFGLELGSTQLIASGSNQAGQWGLLRGAEESISDGARVYPSKTFTNFSGSGILNITGISTDIPYERTTLANFPSGNLDYRAPEFWTVNTHSTSPGGATIEGQSRLRAGRSLFQSITGEGSSQTLGWTRNPFPLDGHLLGGKSNTRGLVASYLSGTKAIELGGHSGDYTRLATQEESFSGIFDISLAQSEGFAVTTLKEEYRVVSFSAQLSEESSPRFRADSYVGKWSRQSGTNTEQTYKQTATGRRISRAIDGTISANDVVNSNRADLVISNRTSLVNDSEGGLNEQDTGRLNLDSNSSLGNDLEQLSLAIGAASPDGGVLAFTLDNPGDGTGLLMAVKPPATGKEITGTFQVQGVITGLSQDENRLQQWQNAQLAIVAGGATTLTPSGHDVSQSLADGSLDTPSELAGNSLNLTCNGCDDSSGQLQFTGSGVTLTGYSNAGEDVMVLQYRQTVGNEERLGLLLAYRRQESAR
ncbi:hypothetical protein C8D92_108141 [Tamilnaduibacter salinus]|uniref:Uncharacterized protein n=1 Tax=Tamilnaduibacter salinus TaxID=1484056 RepID=A0A2U1CUN0_9GAMM|nr:hypothetical protein [Tamilnaduibacter salinus]PVY70785.1 hypothetical protein C8D92_108141 [Tamilnaduibacter salinus]